MISTPWPMFSPTLTALLLKTALLFLRAHNNVLAQHPTVSESDFGELIEEEINRLIAQEVKRSRCDRPEHSP